MNSSLTLLTTTAPRPSGVLKTFALTHADTWRDIDRATAGLGLEIEYVADAALFVARVESEEPAVVIIDADSTWGNADLVTFVRSLWPRSPIFAFVHPWSERADSMRNVVDGLLFKPPRREQWHEALVKGGAMPALEPETPAR